MKETTDNLNDLLRRFADASTADDMAEEIRRGDALLDRCPAPALSPRAEARVRKHLKAAYPKRYRRMPFVGWMSVAAAAVAVIVILFGGTETAPPVQPESRPSAQVQSPVPATARDMPEYFADLWDDTYLVESEESYIALKTEMDNIAAMIEAVRFKKSEFPRERLINGDHAEQRDSQMITTDFWKG